MSKDIEFGFDERTLIAGGTGTGKTVLSKALLNEYYVSSRGLVPIYILDTKIFGDFDEYGQATRNGRIGRIIQSDEPPAPFVPSHQNGSFLVWQTTSTDEGDDGAIGRFLFNIFQARRPCVVFIDEISSFTGNNGQKYPKALDLLYKQGRAHNMAVICCTQAVSYFPKVVLTQTTHAIRLNMVDNYDIRKLSRFMGKATESDPLHQYGFWYRNLMKPIRQNPPLYYKDMQEFFDLR